MVGNGWIWLETAKQSNTKLVMVYQSQMVSNIFKGFIFSIFFTEANKHHVTICFLVFLKTFSKKKQKYSVRTWVNRIFKKILFFARCVPAAAAPAPQRGWSPKRSGFSSPRFWPPRSWSWSWSWSQRFWSPLSGPAFRGGDHPKLQQVCTKNSKPLRLVKKWSNKERNRRHASTSSRQSRNMADD